jgi:tetratricopeptide (TPR) repeat protein
LISFRPSSVTHIRKLAVILSLLFVISVAGSRGQTAAPAPNPPPATPSASALEELPAQMQAVAAAQQSGDVAKIAAANRGLLAVGLRGMAELKLAEGDSKQGVDLYQRSLAFDDSTKTRIALALALMQAHRTDEALSVIEPVTKAEPQNADAWNVQGKLLMDKKSYGPAAEALARSLELQGNPLVAYALASAFLNLNQTDKAQAIFRQMTDTAGSSASVHIMIGRAYQNAGKTEEAAREFNQAAQIDAKGSRAHYFAGLLYLSQNEWVATPAAREQFAEEVKLNPNDFFGNFFLGYIENGDKLYDDSDRHLKIAAQAQPGWPESYLYMGLNAFARRDNQKAEELLRKAIALTGDDVSRNNYQIRRAYYVLGRICFQTDRKDEAAKYTKTFSEMQEKVDEMTRATSPAGKTMGTMGSGMAATPSVPTSAVIDPAAQPGEMAPQLTPQQKAEVTQAEPRLSAVLGSAYNDLGTSEARQKQYSEALANFQQAERWNPAIPHLMRNVGFAAFRAGQHAEAARALKVAEQQDPSDKMIPPMLAMSLFSSDQFADAAKAFDQMGDAVYGDPRVTYAYAVSLARTKQKDRALAVVNRMAQKQLPPDGMLLVGQAYSEVGDPQQALAYFQKALQGNASVPKAHYYTGLAQLQLKQPAAAITEFEAELKLNPGDADAQFQLGKTLLEQGRAKDALPYLETAEKANPKLDGVHAELAAAYRKLGRTADAEREAKLATTEKAPAAANH